MDSIACKSGWNEGFSTMALFENTRVERKVGHHEKNLHTMLLLMPYQKVTNWTRSNIVEVLHLCKNILEKEFAIASSSYVSHRYFAKGGRFF